MNNSALEKSFSKRQFLTLVGVGAAVSVSPSLLASSKHNHHAIGYPKDLVRTAEKCVSIGQACKAHIYQTLKDGDSSLAECLMLVRSSSAACESLVEVLTNGSAHGKAMAKVCADICADCRDECKKHASKHPICKDMADSCDATVKACLKYIG